LQVPGVPLIFGLRNALFLESPSAFQKEYVKTSEERRLHMTDKEYQTFKDKAMKKLADGEADNSNAEIVENNDLGDSIASAQAIKRSIISRNQQGVKDRPQFKRRKAKVIF